MAEKLTCPVWIDGWSGSPNAGGIKTRRQCGKIADEYLVGGGSFTARQVLCVTHRLKAELEGFQLRLVDKTVDSVHNTQQSA